MKHVLSERDISAVEGVINATGHPAAEVKIENGKIVVVEIKRKVVKK